MRQTLPSVYKPILLKKQNYKCNICSTHLDVYDIDHIIPYCIQQKHRFNNLQVLCPTCHARKTRREAREIALFNRCQKTESYRYCWTCKQIVSKYFGYHSGKCEPCFEKTLNTLSIKN